MVLLVIFACLTHLIERMLMRGRKDGLWLDNLGFVRAADWTYQL